MTGPVKLELSLGSRAEESTQIPGASSLAPSAGHDSKGSAVLTLHWQPPTKREPLELQQEAERPLLPLLQKVLSTGPNARGWLELAGTAQSMM